MARGDHVAGFDVVNDYPVQFIDFIDAPEKAPGREAERRRLPPRPGHAPDTYADSDRRPARQLADRPPP